LLFAYLQHCLEGPFFDNDLTLQEVMSQVLMSMAPDMFVSVFAESKCRLQPCIDHGGDYPLTGRIAWPLIKLSGTSPQSNALSAPLVYYMAVVI
jgi:hypothetical protein